MVLLGLIFVVTSLTGQQISLLSMLAGLAPFLFAAAVTYMKPSDPRFLYGAVLIGVGRGLTVMAILIASQGVVRGDIADAMFRLTGFVALPMQSIGVLLLGFAAGGVRTRYGLAILGLGIALAVVGTGWYVVNVVPSLSEALDPIEIWLAALLSPLYPIGWALLAGAAFETRRRLLLLGSIVFLALQTLTVGLDLARPGPDADLSRVLLVYTIGTIIGWLLLTLAPLRLEMGTQRPLREEVEAVPR